jgi:hypothetical protein
LVRFLEHPVARPLPKLGQTSMSLSAIRTHDPSVWAGEDISCLRSCGHCDRLLFT